MGFRGFTPPAPLSQVDARSVLDLSVDMDPGETLPPITFTAAELAGANAIMFVHDTPQSVGSLARLRVFAEADATTGIVAMQREWGEWVGLQSSSDVLWRLPVMLPTFGGDVRVTLNNAHDTHFGLPFVLRAYALRGGDLTPRPVTRGFFYPHPDVNQARGIHIPVISPDYQTAHIEASAEKQGIDPFKWRVRLTRYLIGELSPERVSEDNWDDAEIENVAVVDDAPHRANVTVPISGIHAAKVQLFVNTMPDPIPPRFGFTVTLQP